ncbi:MAG: amidase [Planctomycetota bacterium]|nr:MAG: amidase [Planctomycetota bacterium]REK38336.1 MAG: amidase [Planctomycetota bacterium]
MAVDPGLAFASVQTLAAELRRGAVTSVELTEFFLDRCEQIGPKFNAVTTVLRDDALADAVTQDERLKAGEDLGPLHGIPCGVKDLLATKGHPTSWGAAPYRDRVIDADAAVVTRLRKTGAVLIAKLAMVEIAGGLGYQQANASFTGPGLNPWDASRWSGGSSTGPGSAVAAGLVPFAIGSETWGSIMSPACYCGLSGLRPTYGRVSRRGAMALSWTMDKLGPMCHTADDCGLVLNAIAGPDPDDPTAAERDYSYPDANEPGSPFRIATIKGSADRVQEGVAANYRAALDVLGDYCEFGEIELPDLPYNDAADLILSCEAAAAFEDIVRSGEIQEMTAEEDRWRMYSDLATPAKDYINALRVRGKIQQALDKLLKPFDAVVTPTLVAVAGPIDRPFREWAQGFTSTDIGGAGNVAGIPAITVPSGFGEGGLPTGVQFVGRAFDENRLIAIAREYQQRTDWHMRHPEVL